MNSTLAPCHHDRHTRCVCLACAAIRKIANILEGASPLYARCVEQIAQISNLGVPKHNLSWNQKKQIVDSILETVRKEMSVFIEEESDIRCPIEYELRVTKIAQNFARSLITGAQGKLPKSRNAKKSTDILWQSSLEEGSCFVLLNG